MLPRNELLPPAFCQNLAARLPGLRKLKARIDETEQNLQALCGLTSLQHLDLELCYAAPRAFFGLEMVLQSCPLRHLTLCSFPLHDPATLRAPLL